jgi:hypothetical protein
MGKIRSPKGINIALIADRPKGRGKDKKPRKVGLLRLDARTPNPTKEMLKDSPEVIYWTERVEEMRMMLDKHITATYKKKAKNSPLTPQSLAKIGYEYLKNEIANGRPLTVSGLAYMLRVDRGVLIRLQNMEPKTPAETAFKDVATKLRAFIEMYVEQMLHMKQNPTGSIFVLKNFGWQDKVEMEHSVYQGLSNEEKEEAKTRMLNFSE